MRNIKMTIEYDGSNFKGFQKLKDNENTIQGKLESVLSQMADENIETRPLWKPMHLQPVFKDAPFYGNGTSERLFEIGLCLPSGPTLTDEDVERVTKVVKQLSNFRF